VQPSDRLPPSVLKNDNVSATSSSGTTCNIELLRRSTVCTSERSMNPIRRNGPASASSTPHRGISAGAPLERSHDASAAATGSGTAHS
jgi:hypothetical protein